MATTKTKATKTTFGKAKGPLLLGVEQSLTAKLITRAETSGGFACWMYGGYWMSSVAWVLTVFDWR